jgi:hypothetical protein
VRELLDLMQPSVAEYALDRILNGGEAIPFDEAIHLAMVLSADVSALMERRGLLK